MLGVRVWRIALSVVGLAFLPHAEAQVTFDPPKLLSEPFTEFFPQWVTPDSSGYLDQGQTSIIADLDGDGDNDVALTMTMSTRLTLGPATPIWFLENDGHGNLTRNDAKFLDGTFPGMHTYRQVCLVDVNRDGLADMFIESTGYEGDPATWQGERARLLLRQPDGRFKDVTDTNMPTHKAFAHQGSCLFDLTGDGAPDYYQHTLLPTSWASNLWFNDGTGKYSVVADLGTDAFPQYRLVGSNAYIDPLVVTCFGGPYVTASLRPAPWAPANIYWGQVQNNVFNRDSQTCPEASGPKYVQMMLRNDGSGHFARSLTDLPARPSIYTKTGDSDGAEANHVEVVDIDDDGDDDLILMLNPNADLGEQYMDILLQDSPGHFIDWSTGGGILSGSPRTTGVGGTWLFVADVNGDGAPDLYTAKAQPGFQQADTKHMLWLNDGYGRFSLVNNFTPVMGTPVAVGDLDGDGYAEILSTSINAFPGKPGPALQVTSLHGPTAASIVGAVAPLTRSVQAGQTATAFATIVNASDKPLFGCRIKPPRTRASTFSYQATDPATNAPIGSPNAEMTIAPNGFQSFVFAVSVTGQATGEDLQIQLDCRNTKDAPRIDGLSLFRFSASSTPSPDVVPIALTPSGDGVMRLTGAGRSGFFVAAGINIGAAGQVIVKPVATTAIPAALTICESASNGACLAPPSAQISVAFGANQTKTFSVFGAATADFAPDFANKRVLLDFTAASSLVGRASVAVATGP